MRRPICLFLAIVFLAGLSWTGTALADTAEETVPADSTEEVVPADSEEETVPADSAGEYSLTGDLWSYKTLDSSNVRLAFNAHETHRLCYVPAKINDVPVTEVGNEFISCSEGSYITLPKGLARIDKFAFSGSGFTVFIPDSVKEIDDEAFSLCRDFTILCTAGSYAESFASEKQYTYSTDKKKVSSAALLRPNDNANSDYKKAVSLDKSGKYEEAYNLFLKLAKKGYPRSCFTLGQYYESGKFVAANKKEASKWYLAAAKKDHARAQYAIGLCLLKGRGITRNQKEAVKWFRRAADQGEREGYLWLGYCYHKGLGVEKDLILARDLYQRALTAGARAAAKRISQVNKELKKAGS